MFRARPVQETRAAVAQSANLPWPLSRCNHAALRWETGSRHLELPMLSLCVQLPLMIQAEMRWPRWAAPCYRRLLPSTVCHSTRNSRAKVGSGFLCSILNFSFFSYVSNYCFFVIGGQHRWACAPLAACHCILCYVWCYVIVWLGK